MKNQTKNKKEEKRGEKRYIFLGKKALYYTSVAIIFALVAIIVIETQQKGFTRTGTFESILSLDNLYKDINRDIERSIRITGVRSFLAIIEWEAENLEYIDNGTKAFQEAFMNGTVNGTTANLMINNTYLDWLSRITIQTKNFKANFHATPTKIAITQEDPWSVIVVVNITMNLTEENGRVSWQDSKEVRSKLSIAGFEDPMYSVETGGILANQIIPTTVTDFTDGENVDNLVDHANNSWYVPHQGAPGFLERLEGRFNASAYGIESFVNIDKLELRGGTPKPNYKTVVDHLYFNNYAGTSFTVNGTPNWFRIDNTVEQGTNLTHLEFYQVEELT